MPIVNLSPEALSIIGILISTNIGFVWYMFKGVKSDVKDMSIDIKSISHTCAKLVHKDECRDTSSRIHHRLDELYAKQDILENRIVRLETYLEKKM